MGPSSFGFSGCLHTGESQEHNRGNRRQPCHDAAGLSDRRQQTGGHELLQYVKYSGVFVQDDFRLTSRLTLNFGFRMEHETGPGRRRTTNF